MRRHRGSSLLEVLVAMSLVAIVSLAALSSQTRTLAFMRVSLEYRHAARLADGAAEALRVGMPRDVVRVEWNRRARAVLRGGQFDIARHAAGIDVIEVAWRGERALAGPSASTSCQGELACIRIAIAR